MDTSVSKAIRRFRVTTDSRQTKASPNLIHGDFTSGHPNDLWLSDITYIPTREGWQPAHRRGDRDARRLLLEFREMRTRVRH
jgi:transposase InsO family protein